MAGKGMNVRTVVNGVETLVATLRTLSKTEIGRIGRRAMSLGTTPVLRSARSTVPYRRSGTLKRSLGKRVFTGKHGKNKGEVFGIVGPRKHFAGDWQGKTVRPNKYAHFVELGRRAVTPVTKKVMSDGRVIYGKYARAVPATNWLGRAFERSKAAAEAAVARALREGIEKYAASAPKGGKGG